MSFFIQLLRGMLILSLLWLGSSFLFKKNAGISMSQEALSMIPDYTVTDLSVKQYDNKGLLANAFKTPQLHHIQQYNMFEFIEPNIIVSMPNQAPWQIHSRNGKAYFGGKQIVLFNQVRIYQPALNDHLETTFLTEEITYFPGTKFAETKAPITFQQPGMQVNAVGLEADLKDQHIKLLHQAKGRYEPKKH